VDDIRDIVVSLLFIVCIPIIGLIDYILFREYVKCPKCNVIMVKWYSFIVPTTIEVLLFFSGIFIGGLR